jgi:integral membrane protein (TIGR01906 family)
VANTDNIPPTGPDAGGVDGGHTGSTVARPADAGPDGVAAIDGGTTPSSRRERKERNAPTAHDDAAPATGALPVSEDPADPAPAQGDSDGVPADPSPDAGSGVVDEPGIASDRTPTGTAEGTGEGTGAAAGSHSVSARDGASGIAPGPGEHDGAVPDASASADTSAESPDARTEPAADPDVRAAGPTTDADAAATPARAAATPAQAGATPTEAAATPTLAAPTAARAAATPTQAAVTPTAAAATSTEAAATPAGRGTPALKDDRGTEPRASELDRDAARRAAVRDGVITARPAFPRFLQVVVALFFPIIVVAAAVRAVATSSFLWIEYHRPGFPADSFGFSLDDRMTYGSYALDYVLNFAPPRYLGDLMTPEGAPLFLESEVGHMADVKGVLGVAFAVALVMFVLAVLACIHLARRYKGGIRRALFAGAVITLVGIVALAVLATTAWEAFFTQVHALFFRDGTWTFRIDDTLIRLFPEQFWTDSAVVVGLLVLLATLLTLVLTWPTRGRRERSRRAQEAEQMRYLESLKAS